MWRKRSPDRAERGGEPVFSTRKRLPEPVVAPAPTRDKPTAEEPGLYERHFGLTARPFALAPDPDTLFWTPAHRRAFAMLEYGIMTHAPITLITGEVGSGKTTLLHHLLRSIENTVRIGLISNPNGSRAELLRWVLLSLGEPAAAEETYVDLFARFQDFLIAEYSKGRRVVLIFDEAQNLDEPALEGLRMLTNMNAGKDEVLQLVLVGQPELRTIILRPDLTQFAQRVASSFHLFAMNPATVREYIRHRLIVAGASQDIFSAPAIKAVHLATGGVPRLVNQLCDLAMVYAFSKGQKRVLTRTVQQVLKDGVFFGGGLGNVAPPSRFGPVNKAD